MFRPIIECVLALLLWFTAYSFGETDGSERWKRISKAESKLMCERMQANAERIER